MPDTDQDLLGYPDSGTPGAVAAPPVSLPDQFATEPQITAAVGQLNAGQPVTTLPHQSWSFQQAQAFNAKLDAFDQQAKAARVAADQAARDAQMLDQMSRVAKSSKDITIALQTQDEIGFRNAVASGVPPVQALTGYPRAASSSMVALAKASQPEAMAPAPSVVNLPGGVTGVRSGLHGERFTATSPGGGLSNQGEAILGPDGQVIGVGVPTGPRTRTLVRPPVEGHQGQDVTSAIGILKQQLTQLDKDIADKSFLSTPDAKAQTADLKARRDAVQNRILELNPKAAVSGGSPAGGKGPTGPIVPVPAKKSDLNTTNFYDIQGAVYRWDGTHFQRVPNAR